MEEMIVSICCQTFNHVHYIEKCLDGFLMQKVNFRFEILLRDDASTDGTAEICQTYANKYPDIIRLQAYEENQFSKGVIPFQDNVKRAEGKYIAICEGDDYWTDPCKLQKQVDFLEANEEYVFCYHRFKTLNQNTGEFKEDENGQYFVSNVSKGIEFNYEIFYKGWHIGTQTLMFKSDLIKFFSKNNPFFRDVFMIADLLQNGKGYCLSDFMAVYRKHEGGVYSGIDDLKRAEDGMSLYRAIYCAYPQDIFLKLKYRKFALVYIRHLIHQNNNFKVLKMLFLFLVRDKYFKLFRDAFYLFRKHIK